MSDLTISDQDTVLLPLIVKRAQRISDRVWLNAYFELMRRLLKANNLGTDDPRLCLSLPKDGYFAFPFTVNNRYILAPHLSGKNSNLRMLCDAEVAESLPVSVADIRAIFKPFSGETIADAPVWVRFDDPQTVLDNTAILDAVMSRLGYELNRAKGTPNRRSHQDTIYRLAIDTTFRDFVWDETFGDTAGQQD